MLVDRRQIGPATTGFRHVTHVALRLSRLGAGVSNAALQLGVAQQAQGTCVQWACLHDEYLATDVAERAPWLAEAVRSFPALGPRQLALSPAFRRGVAGAIDASDLVHIHGLWSAPCHTAARLARRRGVPYLVAPHGMLDGWALRHRRWRKRLARVLVERPLLERAACVHALVGREHRDIRRFGCRRPVAVVPNGIDLAELDDCVTTDRDLSPWPELVGRRVALFLSRVHSKKGLPILLQAWAALARRHCEWILVIAGPGENGHDRHIRRLIRHWGVERHVLMTGPVHGRRKVALLRRAELLALPSYSEGFSMSVLEALACRLPVLITPACNFPEVETVGAGCVVPPAVPDLREGLSGLLQGRAEELARMGGRGRKLVQRQYSWPRVANRLDAVYQWLLGGGSPPNDVITD